MSSPTSWRWRVVGLLFLATMLNYMDRLALNNTSRYILEEFEPDASKHETLYASLEIAFGVSFALFQLVAGVLADRFRLRRLYLIALIIWSLAGFLTGLIPTGAIAMLIMCRVMLGVGEAFNWPCAVGTVRRVIPRESRGLANGFFHSGASIGAILTPLFVYLLVIQMGGNWRWVFLIIGGMGIVWGVMWVILTRGDRGKIIDQPPEPDPGDRAELNTFPLSGVFFLRLFWITLIVGCTVNITWHFFRTWLIRYAKMDLGSTKEIEQFLLMAFFIAADVGSMVAGFMTRKFVEWGYTVERSRKFVMLGNAGLCVLAGIGASLGQKVVFDSQPTFWQFVGANWQAFALFSMVAAGSMGGFAIFFSLAQDVVARHTSTILGVIGCTAWLMISTVNWFVGTSADNAQTFVPWIIVIGFVPMIGAIAQLFWPEKSSDRSTVSEGTH